MGLTAQQELMGVTKTQGTHRRDAENAEVLNGVSEGLPPYFLSDLCDSAVNSLTVL